MILRAARLEMNSDVKTGVGESRFCSTNWYFSLFNVLWSNLGILLKCRFWQSQYRVGTRVYISNKLPGNVRLLHPTLSIKTVN